MQVRNGTGQELEQPPSEFHILLRANNELMIRFDRTSDIYAKNVEALTAETALYRKELEESRKEVNELQKEIANLKELIQSFSLNAPTTVPSTQVSSPGRSWASVVSQSSLASSNTRAARAGLGLPAVVLNLCSAAEETKALVDDPTQTREKIREVLRNEPATANVDVVGVKPTSRTTVKVFVDSEESVASLRRATHWLNALPSGVNLSTVLLKLFQQYQIVDRVLAITTDNTSNNNTLVFECSSCRLVFMNSYFMHCPEDT